MSFGSSLRRTAAALLLFWAAGCTGQDLAPDDLSGPERQAASVPPGGASFTFDQTEKLLAPDPAENAGFGGPLALDGDTLLVSAPIGKPAGTAYVFVRVNGQWVLEQQLDPPDGQPWDEFGSAVALSGDTAVVGARYAELGALGKAGAVYVFTRTAGNWGPPVRLTQSDVAAGDELGYGLAIEGDTLFAGAIGKTGAAGQWTGAVYVFQRAGDTWTEVQKIQPPSPGTVERFGRSAVIQGETALIGTNSDDFGRVYSLSRANGLWTIDATISSSDGVMHDRFGFALALDGDRALASAIRAEVDGTPDSGALYVLERTGGVWTETAKLVASNPSFVGDELGWCVALQGDLALAGSTIANSAAGQSTGAVYAFSRSNGVWGEEKILVANETKPYDGVGSGVAIQAGTLVVGAHALSADFSWQGGAYVFSVGGLPAVQNGAACALDTDCSSGHCAGGVCCDTPCDGACHACSVATGAIVDGVCAPVTGPACDDGDACTQADTCQAGQCQGGDPVVCAAPGACHEQGTCDSATGTCDDPTSPDGTPCPAGTCQSGTCVASATGGTGGTGGTAGTGGGGAAPAEAGTGDVAASGGCQSSGPASSTGLFGAGMIGLALGLSRRRRRPR